MDRNLNSLNRSDVRLARTNAVAGSADALVRQALRDVLDDSAVRASADGKGVEVRELLQWQAVLECPHRRLATSRVHPRLFNPGEAVARFFFSLLGTNSLEHIAFYLPAARGYSADGVLISGHAHGNRLFQRIGPASQIERAVALLAEGDNNRALMTIHAPTDAGTGPTDLPCVTSLFLFRRGDALHAAAQLRSSDVFRLLLYDLFELTMLQEYVASLCGLALGVRPPRPPQAGSRPRRSCCFVANLGLSRAPNCRECIGSTQARSGRPMSRFLSSSTGWRPGGTLQRSGPLSVIFFEDFRRLGLGRGVQGIAWSGRSAWPEICA